MQKQQSNGPVRVFMVVIKGVAMFIPEYQTKMIQRLGALEVGSDSDSDTANVLGDDEDEAFPVPYRSHHEDGTPFDEDDFRVESEDKPHWLQFEEWWDHNPYANEELAFGTVRHVTPDRHKHDPKKKPWKRQRRSQARAINGRRRDFGKSGFDTRLTEAERYADYIAVQLLLADEREASLWDAMVSFQADWTPTSDHYGPAVQASKPIDLVEGWQLHEEGDRWNHQTLNTLRGGEQRRLGAIDADERIVRDRRHASMMRLLEDPCGRDPWDFDPDPTGIVSDILEEEMDKLDSKSWREAATV